jgi:hypothetical protein
VAYILATEEFRLNRRFGGIFCAWNDAPYAAGKVYGILERLDEYSGSANTRPVYDITDGADTTEATPVSELNFDSKGLDGDIPVRCAQFVSGQIQTLIDVPTLFEDPEHPGTPYQGFTQIVYGWEKSGVWVGEQALWPNSCAFAMRLEDGGIRRGTFFLGEADGLLVRWASDAPAPPGYSGQFIPWRTEGGQIKALDFDDTPESGGSIELPTKYIVIANQGGWVVWLDVSGWTNDIISAKHHKSFGAIQARDISDIAIDRTNNILWVLDNGTRLLKYELEPFGTEADGYANTPKEIVMRPSSKIVAPDGTISLTGELYDMWGQRIETPGLTYEVISGNARGKFLEGSTYKTKARGVTGVDGRFTATYKANP